MNAPNNGKTAICYGGNIVGERTAQPSTINPQPSTSASPRHWLRPIRAEDVEPLTAMAREDNHSLTAATHVFERQGQYCGAVSFGVVPLVLPWFHTKLCHPSDSLFFISVLENLMANALPPNHHGHVCVPFAPHSPFAPYISRLGYSDGETMRVCFKKLK